MKLIDLYESLKGVEINNVDGVGAVPYNLDVGYRGFVKKMKPSEFLSLAAKIEYGFDEDELKELFSAMKEQGMGSPFLHVEWIDDKWQVYGHEGRHRMEAIRRFIGDIDIDVHIFPYKKRSRDISSDMANAEILPEK